MAYTRNPVDQAKEILELFKTEKILPTPKEEIKALNWVRNVTPIQANNNFIIAPALTSCIATSLLGYNLCQELTQRFVLEYCIKFKEKNLSLIFTSNPETGYTDDDHMFVIIGPLKVPDSLIIGKGDNEPNAKPKINNQPISQFIDNHRQCIFVDPLLNCIGHSDLELKPLLDYFRKHNLTHVIGIRPYHETPLLIENAPDIKQNAINIANSLQPLASKNKAAKPKPTPTPTTSSIFHSNSQTHELDPIVKRYQLPDTSQLSLEKALRNAATNNKIEDLKILLKCVKNINAQDANPNVKRTALHWAAIKDHMECYDLLIEAEARKDILDKEGKSAVDYLPLPSSKKLL